jgi:hypothetical protein
VSNFINNAILQFEYYKGLAEKTFAQLIEKQLFEAPLESNSIAIIVQHLSGNMLSRWTNFLTTDGEKEWRNRDAEFELHLQTKVELLQTWEKGWRQLITTLKSLTDADLETIVYIRKIGQTVQDAIARQLCHYSYHVGQIVYIGKMLKQKDFVSLSIPKNTSVAYNAEKFEKEKSVKFFGEEEK